LTVSSWARSTRAQVVVVENVPNFLDSWYWARLRSTMETLGYECAEWVLKAEQYGAPQLRARAFGVFSKIGLPAMPKPSTRAPMTVREAFDGLPVEPKAWMRPGVSGAIQVRSGDDMHVAPLPSAIALERFKRLPPCGGRRDLASRAPHLCPPSWRRLGVEATDVWGRIDYDRPSNTLRCDFQNASKGRYVHPIANRVITLREGARIQGVPDDWRFEGARSHIAEQIGNGVPLPLGRAVARALRPLFS
jgi:DNA (cytosine-5)-methyltransferase 1